jgi:hypothetical protein
MKLLTIARLLVAGYAVSLMLNRIGEVTRAAQRVLDVNNEMAQYGIGYVLPDDDEDEDDVAAVMSSGTVFVPIVVDELPSL